MITDATVVAIVAGISAVVAAIPSTLMALGAYRAAGLAHAQGKVNEEKAKEVSKQVAETAKQNDEIIGKAEAIQTQTDGHLSHLTEQLEEANQTIAKEAEARKKQDEVISQLIDRMGASVERRHSLAVPPVPDVPKVPPVPEVPTVIAVTGDKTVIAVTGDKTAGES